MKFSKFEINVGDTVSFKDDIEGHGLVVKLHTVGRGWLAQTTVHVFSPYHCAANSEGIVVCDPEWNIFDVEPNTKQLTWKVNYTRKNGRSSTVTMKARTQAIAEAKVRKYAGRQFRCINFTKLVYNNLY